jgi:hypothetical protein
VTTNTSGEYILAENKYATEGYDLGGVSKKQARRVKKLLMSGAAVAFHTRARMYATIGPKKKPSPAMLEVAQCVQSFSSLPEKASPWSQSALGPAAASTRPATSVFGDLDNAFNFGPREKSGVV